MQIDSFTSSHSIIEPGMTPKRWRTFTGIETCHLELMRD